VRGIGHGRPARGAGGRGPRRPRRRRLEPAIRPIAATPEEYRRIAIANAAVSTPLAELSSQMRARLAASALGNPNAFVRYLESAYREMMIARFPS
jgi:hypothetical protein